jgi:dual specificity phosphatase 12
MLASLRALCNAEPGKGSLDDEWLRSFLSNSSDHSFSQFGTALKFLHVLIRSDRNVTESYVAHLQEVLSVDPKYRLRAHCIVSSARFPLRPDYLKVLGHSSSLETTASSETVSVTSLDACLSATTELFLKVVDNRSKPLPLQTEDATGCLHPYNGVELKQVRVRTIFENSGHKPRIIELIAASSAASNTSLLFMKDDALDRDMITASMFSFLSHLWCSNPLIAQRNCTAYVPDTWPACSDFNKKPHKCFGFSEYIPDFKTLKCFLDDIPAMSDSEIDCFVESYAAGLMATYIIDLRDRHSENFGVSRGYNFYSVDLKHCFGLADRSLARSPPFFVDKRLMSFLSTCHHGRDNHDTKWDYFVWLLLTLFDIAFQEQDLILKAARMFCVSCPSISDGDVGFVLNKTLFLPRDKASSYIETLISEGTNKGSAFESLHSIMTTLRSRSGSKESIHGIVGEVINRHWALKLCRGAMILQKGSPGQVVNADDVTCFMSSNFSARSPSLFPGKGVEGYIRFEVEHDGNSELMGALTIWFKVPWKPFGSQTNRFGVIFETARSTSDQQYLSSKLDAFRCVDYLKVNDVCEKDKSGFWLASSGTVYMEFPFFTVEICMSNTPDSLFCLKIVPKFTRLEDTSRIISASSNSVLCRLNFKNNSSISHAMSDPCVKILSGRLVSSLVEVLQHEESIVVVGHEKRVGIDGLITMRVLDRQRNCTFNFGIWFKVPSKFPLAQTNRFAVIHSTKNILSLDEFETVCTHLRGIKNYKSKPHHDTILSSAQVNMWLAQDVEKSVDIDVPDGKFSLSVRMSNEPQAIIEISLSSGGFVAQVSSIDSEDEEESLVTSVRDRLTDFAVSKMVTTFFSLKFKAQKIPLISEVLDGKLWIGTIVAAQDLDILNDHRITHVVSFTQFGEQANFHKDRIKYHTVLIHDLASSNIGQFLTDAVSFIQSALSNPAYRVLVHCNQGRSRSATIVAAYLISTGKCSSAQDAFRFLKIRRPCVNPNHGFQRQLQDWAGSRALGPNTSLQASEVNESETMQSPGPVGCHVMFSYPWGPHQENVRDVAKNLRANGFDVWIDVYGSTILGKIEGAVATDEIMAQASSSFVFIIIPRFSNVLHHQMLNISNCVTFNSHAFRPLDCQVMLWSL